MYSIRGSGSQGISRASIATLQPAKLQRCGIIDSLLAADMQDFDVGMLPSNPFPGDSKNFACRTRLLSLLTLTSASWGGGEAWNNLRGLHLRKRAWQ